MAIGNKNKLEETYTDFGGGPESRFGSYFNATGVFGKWLAKFFSKRGAQEVAKQYKDNEDEVVYPIAGDTIASEDQIKGTTSPESYSRVRFGLHLPETEVNRRRRYEEFEKMDEYPEIGAAFDIYCLAGDSVIPLLNGTHRTLIDLYNSKEKDFLVYSYDIDKKRVSAGLCEKVIKTGINQNIYAVEFDDGTVIKATPTHKFLSSGGIYKYAKDLKEGDSILALIRLKVKNHSQNYENVLMKPWVKEWKSSHRMVLESIDGPIPKGMVVHHKDYNGLNNNYNNLQILTKQEHDLIHDVKGKNNPRYRHDIKQKDFIDLINKGYLSREKLGKALGCSYRVIDRLTKEIGYESYGDLKEKVYNLNSKSNINSKKYNLSYINHKVVSVKYFGKEDTYCLLNVNKYHNFAVGSQLDYGDNLNSKFVFVANSDDSTQRNIRGDRWSVKSDSITVIEEVEKLFKRIKLDRFYWDITRNVYKYGDCFIEIIVDLNNPEAGIQRIKILNPKFILRQEDKYGYLQAFYQEIPEKDSDPNYTKSNSFSNKIKYIPLDKNQIIHFRLHTSDPLYYPYGKSIAALGIRIYRSLKLMEDAMLIYRLARAPERRVFYIDVGTMPTSKAEMFMERIKMKFKKEKFYNAGTGQIDARYNPLSADEDFYVPVRNGSQATKIDTLRGAENLGEVDDVKYFRDKLLAAMKIPKDYIVEKDKSPERKANLSQLDVKFARAVTRGQHCIEIGLEILIKKHLEIKKYPSSLIANLRLELPDPSDMFTKRKLEIDEAKARIVAGVLGTGLFPRRQIYKEYYDLTDAEIDEIEKELEKDIKKSQEQQMAGGQQEQGGAGGGIAGGMAPQGTAMDNSLQTGQVPQPKQPENTTIFDKLIERYQGSEEKLRFNRMKRNLPSLK